MDDEGKENIRTIIIVLITALALVALSPMFNDVFSSIGRFITSVGMFFLG